MNRLIVIQNSWRIHDNPMLCNLSNSDCKRNYIVGCIPNYNARRVYKHPQRGWHYQKFSELSASEFSYLLFDKYQITCKVYPLSLIQLLELILSKQPDITHCRFEQPIAYDERKTLQHISNVFPDLTIETIWCNALFQAEELNMPAIVYKGNFTSWRKTVESKRLNPAFVDCSLKNDDFYNLHVDADEIDFPKKTLHIMSQLCFEPGEMAGLKRLKYFLFDSNLVQTYKQTRNALLGLDYSSKFSPWMAHGALSPRHIYREIQRYETSIKSNESTYWLKFELLWREFFRHAMYHFPREYFLRQGFRHEALPCIHNESQWQQWCEGKTVSDFINANMIELNTTGYLSNRGRQIVASYLINTLNLNWLRGAAYFESRLVDYDVCSNWGNWAYLAGVGNATRKHIFNVDKQQKQFDPNHEYINHWLSQG